MFIDFVSGQALFPMLYFSCFLYKGSYIMSHISQPFFFFFLAIQHLDYCVCERVTDQFIIQFIASEGLQGHTSKLFIAFLVQIKTCTHITDNASLHFFFPV